MGARKTTFAREFPPNYLHYSNLVNADIIADRLPPRAEENAAIATGRWMLQIEALAQQPADFGFETTLAGRGHRNFDSGLEAARI